MFPVPRSQSSVLPIDLTELTPFNLSPNSGINSPLTNASSMLSFLSLRASETLSPPAPTV
ncbi:TPA: hypothetical protein DIU22_03570 [Candidatus Woesebacteria bacterium]|nr:hypothetical protein [Candidatus Woesebacteria bacterium]